MSDKPSFPHHATYKQHSPAYSLWWIRSFCSNHAHIAQAASKPNVRVVQSQNSKSLPVDELTGSTEQERRARHIDQIKLKKELADNTKNQTTTYTIDQDRFDGTAK